MQDTKEQAAHAGKVRHWNFLEPGRSCINKSGEAVEVLPMDNEEKLREEGRAMMNAAGEYGEPATASISSIHSTRLNGNSVADTELRQVKDRWQAVQTYSPANRKDPEWAIELAGDIARRYHKRLGGPAPGAITPRCRTRKPGRSDSMPRPAPQG